MIKIFTKKVYDYDFIYDEDGYEDQAYETLEAKEIILVLFGKEFVLYHWYV